MGQRAPYSTSGNAFAVDLLSRWLITKVGSVVFEATAASVKALLPPPTTLPLALGVTLRPELPVPDTARRAFDKYRQLYLRAAQGKGRYLVATTYGGLGNRHLVQAFALTINPNHA